MKKVEGVMSVLLMRIVGLVCIVSLLVFSIFVSYVGVRGCFVFGIVSVVEISCVFGVIVLKWLLGVVMGLFVIIRGIVSWGCVVFFREVCCFLCVYFCLWRVSFVMILLVGFWILLFGS